MRASRPPKALESGLTEKPPGAKKKVAKKASAGAAPARKKLTVR